MNIYNQQLILPSEEIATMQGLLNAVNINPHDVDADIDMTYRTYTAKFQNGYEADIKICAGSNNFYIDAVLFDDCGFERSAMSDIDELEGEYSWDDGADVYNIVIRGDAHK